LLKNPSSAGDERLSRELSSVLRRDLVYSPAANREQARRGRFVEETVGEWLSGLGLSYKTEADCRREGRVKTPDFLLDSPSVVCGRRVNWVESKASFGDYIEVKSDSRKQVRHYVDLFGPGAVVYWYGFLGESFRGDVTLLSHSDIKGKTK
ncbi:MAG: TPD domain-containing protein, partial [Candidatus Altiarchaeota archaeon]